MKLLKTINRYYCPVCDKNFRNFKTFGLNLRPNAQCPGCGSLERHRLLLIALQKLSLLSNQRRKNLLHIAPEPCLALKLKQTFEYTSVDLDGARAMMQMDIMNLQFPDAHFDGIICNHVLEHVSDDRKALSELYRVLKPKGWASIQVPIDRDTTDEDHSVVDPSERERRFGQHDHVRSYGLDFQQRLEDVGFSVVVFPKEKLLNKEMLNKISAECEEGVWMSFKN